MKCIVRFAALGCLVVSGFAHSTYADATVNKKPAIEQYEYSYFNQRIALGVNPEMIAVFTDPQRAQPAVAVALTAVGINNDMITPSTAAGWEYVQIPRAIRSDALIENLMTQLSQQRAYDFVSPVFIGTGGNPVVITRDVLIAFNQNVANDAALALITEQVPGNVLDQNFAGTTGLFRIRTSLHTAREVLDLVNGLAQNPMIAYAQSDMIYWAERSGTYTPNDPQYPQQWALNHVNDHDMNAPEAWNITTGDPNIVVVVLDSGIDQAHTDISQIPGMNFTTANAPNGGPGGQCDNHATAVGGCVAATIDNNTGVVGIAPGCRVRSGKIFNELFFIFFCSPFLESQDSWTVGGINWAASTGARVTNSSWGGGTASAAITTAFNSTRAQGVLHFAAAGNDGTSTIGFPANLASVNAVSATNVSGNLASFSTFGSGLFIAAPGEGILTTDRMGAAGYGSGNTTTIDGTSFACPYTCGVAALVLSVDPSLTPAEVETILAATAKDRGAAGYDTSFGWGIVNAHAAMVEAMPDVPLCPANLESGDNVVDVFDLFILLSNWGTSGSGAELADDTNIVDVFDLFVLLSAWGNCP